MDVLSRSVLKFEGKFLIATLIVTLRTLTHSFFEQIITKYTEKSRRAKIDQVIKATCLPIIKSCGGYAIFGAAFVLFVIFNRGNVLLKEI